MNINLWVCMDSLMGFPDTTLNPDFTFLFANPNPFDKNHIVKRFGEETLNLVKQPHGKYAAVCVGEGLTPTVYKGELVEKMQFSWTTPKRT